MKDTHALPPSPPAFLFVAFVQCSTVVEVFID